MNKQYYQTLVDDLTYYNYCYYVLAAPAVTDAKFDQLYAELERIESAHPEWITPDSPTQHVGSDLKAGSTRRLVSHRTPMLSCQKAQDTATVQRWLNHTESLLPPTSQYADPRYILEWKLDGLSCSLVYYNGCLISAATRGDGQQGQSLLDHVGYIFSIPAILNGSERLTQGRIEVRGEIFLPSPALTLVQRPEGGSYADSRTAAAALCNQEQASTQCSLLQFRPWELIAPQLPGSTTRSNSLDILDAYGFQHVDTQTANSQNLLAVLARMEQQRSSLTFPVDGIVIKINDRAQSDSLGFTAHHPKGNIAYKFAPAKTQTVVTDIRTTVGATGKQTVVASLAPVQIMGRTVKSVSVGTPVCASKMAIGVGCTVEVGLSNDVRPKIYRVIDPVKNQSFEPVIAYGSTAPGAEPLQQPEQGRKRNIGSTLLAVLATIAYIISLPCMAALFIFGVPVLTGKKFF